MTRAVFDANALLSGFIGLARPGQSAPGSLMNLLENRAFEMILSEDIVGEVQEALKNRYFRDRIDDETQRQLVEGLRGVATIVSLVSDVQGVAPDPHDDHILDAAVSGDVDYLVTGDQALLALQECEGIRIVSPREFLEIVESQ